MDQPSPTRLYFAGTDTDVGKTYVAAMATRELRHSGNRVAVYKPVASGCILDDGRVVSDDAIKLWEASGRELAIEAICPQRFLAPLSPPAAARREGKTVDVALLVAGLDAVSAEADYVVIEGAGGLMSPLADDLLNSDLARQIGAKVIIVASNRLGTIHQVLSTVTAAAALQLSVAGIVLNQTEPVADDAAIENAAAISRFTRVPILGTISYAATTSRIHWDALPTTGEPLIPIAKAWL